MTSIDSIIEEPQQAQAVRYRPATPADELHIIAAFSHMLRELEPFGHDVLPTDANVDLFWERFFMPALASGKHGCVLAFVGSTCVGAILATGERTIVETPRLRAILHALWVSPAWREHGIATELQRQSMRMLAAAGFEVLLSNVLRHNEAGFKTQLKAGSSVIGYVTCTNLKGVC